MKTHSLVQGSQEWSQHRLTHFNASDAPAMMGCSPYQTRTELLARMKTGITQDVDAGTQRRFDDGHRFEALARPLAEQIIGEELSPVTGTNGQLSASFDGLTFMGDTAFEHKTLGEPLRYTPWDEGNGYHLPLHYQVQMEQQLLVSGAERVLFMATKWADDTLIEERHCWYASDAALRAKIVAGWAQFAKDLIEFTPTAAEVKPTGKAPEALPALHIVIQGGVSASNLDEFKETALGAIRSVNRELTTDVHFADAEKAVKWCSDIEDRIKAAKDHALSQTASIDALFRTMDEISAEARRVRLDLDKLVKARKESMKAEIVASGVSALAKHIRELNAAMPADYMPTVPADFGGAIKGLRTIDSITNAVDTELARAKIAAAEVANRIHANVKAIDAAGSMSLFADVKTLVLKAPDDLAAIIAQRVAAEQQRKEAERERIRAEEAAKLAKAQAEREHQDRLNAEFDAQTRAQEAQSASKNNQLIHEVPYVAPAVVQPAAAPAATVVSMPVRAAAPSTPPTLRLGQISERLGFNVTSAFLISLGFEPAAKDKAAMLYHEATFTHICAALVRHINAIQVSQAA